MLRARFSQTVPALRRSLATAAVEKEGSIADAFSSLGVDSNPEPLGPKYTQLKQDIWRDGMIETWRSLLAACKERTEEIKAIGNKAIPQVDYKHIANRTLDDATINEIKRVGTVVIRGGVPEQEALSWKSEIQDYIKLNRSMAGGFPNDNPMVWEIYNSVGQTKARTSDGVLNTSKFLLSLFHASDPQAKVSLSNPVAYYDRLRIRFPGDSLFALGPHVDGGSCERWDDPDFRACWSQILSGDPLGWQKHDSFDVGPRLTAKTDTAQKRTGQCSVYRAFQGWTALSHTGPGEGTLQVFPDLNLGTAYLILRPFFRPRHGREDKLGFDDWEIDTASSIFPGSVPGKGQELNARWHPHLQLNETMVSVPTVRPGDQVYWHGDVIHSVEAKHGGITDSSVLYIPICPLTKPMAGYLKGQKETFEAGLPPIDFPGGKGESQFVGRASLSDCASQEGKRALGYAPFEAPLDATPGEQEMVKWANQFLA